MKQHLKNIYRVSFRPLDNWIKKKIMERERNKHCNNPYIIF